MGKVKCAVERAGESMMPMDQEALRLLILDDTISAGEVSSLLNSYGYERVDRAAIGHYRRKVKAGKANCEFG